MVNKENPMQGEAFHIYDRSTSTLTLFSGEIKVIESNHLNNESYLFDVKEKAIAEGFINQNDYICEWVV